MSCTKEEIERKRLAALQKRQSKVLQNNVNTPSKYNGNQSSSGLIKYNGNPNSPGPVASSKYNNGNHNSPGSMASRAGPVKNIGYNSSHKNGYHPYSKPGTSSTESSYVPVDKVVSGTVYLISEDRFEVNPSEFCTPLINIFKTIPSKNYDPKSKLWNFSMDDYDLFISKVAPLAPHIVLGSLPPYVLKILRENTINPESIDLTPVEATLRHKLMPFQEEGVRFAIARGGRCMIADDMGLGKTFQALAVASYYRHDWPLLIVTTSSMRETWQSTIHELLPSVPLMNIVTLTTSKDAALVADKQSEIVIVSYKITTMHSELLKSKKFGVVIIDESHFLKSPRSQCCGALQGAGAAARRALLLSGTPALSRPAELYTQLNIICPRLFGSYTEYGKRYCAGKQTAFGWDMSGQSRGAELSALLRRKFLVRRTKEQVLTLREKTREAVLLDSSLLQHDAGSLPAGNHPGGGQKTIESHAALLTLFSESARVKIPAVCAYLRALVSSRPDKFLVFAHHRVMLDAVCRTLDEARVSYICIDGSTPTQHRAELVDRFQSSPSCLAGVLSITAANSGLTLTAASLVLFAELHWNPGIITQAESRAHRLGQARAVTVRVLLAPGTADHHMWDLLQGKLTVLNNVGLSKESFDNTTMKHQDSKQNSITNYTIQKNKNLYIPGTNIRKDSIGNCRSSTTDTDRPPTIDPDTSKQGDISDSDLLEMSFLEDTEDDELLANLDLG